MLYPYQNRDLLKEPENYFYAQCEHWGFLQSWIASRDEALKRLQREQKDSKRHGTKSIAAPPGGFILREKIIELVEKAVSGRWEEIDPVFEALIKKFEVFRRLFAIYQRDGVRAPESATADLGTYILFGKLLLTSVQKRKSLRHLSTLMKLLDALASQSFGNLSSDEASELIALLHGEREAVLCWE